MKIYVVNLDERKDRMNKMKGQLQRLGLDYVRFPAINGRDVFDSDSTFNRKRFFLENGRKIVPGEIGCALSHMSIWKEVARSGAYALILEDDANISDAIVRFIQTEELYSKFDFLKIDSCHLKKRQEKDGSEKLDISSYTGDIFNKHECNNFVAFECDPVPYSFGGYVISSKAAKYFLEVSRNSYYPVDLLPRYSRGMLKLGFLEVALSNFGDLSDTNIGGRIKESSLSFFDRLLWFPHKVFNRRRCRQFELVYMYGFKYFWRKK